jgi:hypothetical protein
LAHFWTVKAVLPKMINADSGHIVTVASVAGLMTGPKIVDYGASKVQGADRQPRQRSPFTQPPPAAARRLKVAEGGTARARLA